MLQIEMVKVGSFLVHVFGLFGICSLLMVWLVLLIVNFNSGLVLGGLDLNRD